MVNKLVGCARVRTLVAVVLLLVAGTGKAATTVEVKGLFAGSALLVIDGKQQLLKQGRRSPEGVLLVSADSKFAVVEVDGQRHKLTMSRRISSGFQKAERASVRLQSGRGGHYVTPGRINGKPVEFLVDTGATSVSMNLPTAKRLGINYRIGREITLSTANGLAKAFLVKLDSVRIGEVEVRNVEATVSIGDFPEVILLGNSYLSRVEMSQDSGILVLESKL
ncbi:TIGR02281 family clan AA aspartic protease [Exilibacterium tricleocarpae]|uniref:TIGR02281 family clan AA aspartic protease n=1 Tax=Exilibacterium tricleocarpae TaxID=2591008 RepID=A0A545SPQ0_9GAMM|nr:TIGR02281 family clan AA aspartic protease [Exilibacterium tricleocarpae]TQV66953.1 TIGR02281 family clan AA aspartic protease [Exilibacterium tricleocarpae]